MPRSRPNATAITAARTATPRARRIHSSAPKASASWRRIHGRRQAELPRERSLRRRHRPVEAPSCERLPHPRAAPVRMSPRMGPAQGAHSRPVPMPSRNELVALGPASEFCERRLPRRTSGRDSRSASEGKDPSQPENAKQHQSRDAAELVGADGPPSADGRETGHESEGDGHESQQRERALAEWLVGTCEDERQHRRECKD